MYPPPYGSTDGKPPSTYVVVGERPQGQPVPKRSCDCCKLSKNGKLMLLFSLVTIMSIVGLGVSSYAFQQSIDSVPSARGTIYGLQSGKSQYGGATLFLQYYFTVNDTKYYGGSQLCSTNDGCGTNTYNGYIWQYPINSTIVIYYDHDAPSDNSIVQKDLMNTGFIAAVVLLTLFTALMLGVTLSFAGYIACKD